MNRKWLLICLLVLTVIATGFFIIRRLRIRYHKLIIDSEKWDSIINSRRESTSLTINSIEFNDYHLLIDNENSSIYYSVVDGSNKFNPRVEYKTDQKASIVINDKITSDKLEQIDSLKIMIYNDKEYRIYSLVVTNYPILNVIYKDTVDEKNKVKVDLELFDNHIDSPQRVLKSNGVFRIIEENQTYSFSLWKQSLGNNKRENPISIFGMEKRDDYLMKKVESTSDNDRYVKLFINNQYSGIYSLGPKGRINIHEQNKENNK